ncbi:hypothetical protein CXB51_014115 [Gossypium anomalum]|uniref:non-specific serine/threonine protein kinase n=1 Tax=Gossypium anomalum TaxID=47600 RepID=A0A8J5Z2J8_9ROSI|nr:hypothetical protein CXB51_014115 [Gossypium anomalum]
MNFKISDFGMVKLFNLDQTRTDTNKIVGTLNSVMWVNILVCLLTRLIAAMSVSFDQSFSCYADSGNFTTNTTYAKNQDFILHSLSNNVSEHGGFFTVTVGQGSNKAYALGLCRGDITSYVCHSCVKLAVDDLRARCPSQKEAVSWSSDPPCILHYANCHFFKMLELHSTTFAHNNRNITSNLPQYDTVWESLMDSVVTKASNGSSTLKYATGKANFTASKTIYALTQCNPNLAHNDCDSCLRELVSFYKVCCHQKQGARIQNPNYWLGWDLHGFYVPNPTTTAPSLSPPLAPGTPLTITKGNHASYYMNIPMISKILIRSLSSWINKKSDEKKLNKSIWVPSLSAALGLALFSACCFFLCKRINIQEDKEDSQEVQLLDLVLGNVPHENSSGDFSLENMGRSLDFPSIQLDILQAATNNFCDENKLGQGGFGLVYKGTRPNGKEIAVKRLSIISDQGLLEFKNEVILIAKLQHRNLVRLLGCCLEKNEMLLVYEFMPNRSLDVFLFSLILEPLNSIIIFIIKGIARGIMYLHEDSHLRIIHRDLKASNVLLDHKMNPKILDFGMAKIFGRDQNQAITNRIWIYGVLLLEIISRKRNNGFQLLEHGESLLTFAWKLWSKCEGMKLIDEHLVEPSVSAEVLKCIQIGLLCVQVDPANRPTMSTVVSMLGSDNITLHLPAEPTFYVRHFVVEPIQPNSSYKICSINEVTMLNKSPR